MKEELYKINQKSENLDLIKFHLCGTTFPDKNYMISLGGRAGEYSASTISEITGIEARETVLGYTQRGGSPCSFDRILSTRMGNHAVELIAAHKFGRMVSVSGGDITSVPLEETGGTRLVSPDHELIIQGQHMGICFG